jgi:putative flippase GtrA
VALPITVTVLRRTLQKPEGAPYIGAALLTIVTVILSFFGHRHFSFRQKLTEEEINSGQLEKGERDSD